MHVTFRVPEGTEGRGYGGAGASLTLTGDASADVAAAIALEHSDDHDCQVCVAAREGFILHAAVTLRGATETPLLDRVIAHYWPELTAEAIEQDRQAFLAAVPHRECPSCHSVAFDLADGDHTCPECLADLRGRSPVVIDVDEDGMYAFELVIPGRDRPQYRVTAVQIPDDAERPYARQSWRLTLTTPAADGRLVEPLHRLYPMGAPSHWAAEHVIWEAIGWLTTSPGELSDDSHVFSAAALDWFANTIGPETLRLDAAELLAPWVPDAADTLD